MNQLVFAPQLTLPASAPMVVARRLSADDARSGRPPLRNLDLVVPTGAFFVALGGASSTLVRLLSGLERPARGGLSVGGVALESLTECEALAYRRFGVNVVLPSHNLLPDLTLQQNLEVPLLLTQLSRRERAERARSALELVGLGRLSNRRADQVTAGAAQRAAIARTLLSGANLIVLHEPCAHVEAQERALVLDLLSQLNRVFQKTIVLASEDPDAADRASQVEELAAGAPRRASVSRARPVLAAVMSDAEAVSA